MDKVTKEEFDAFIDNYPMRLTVHLVAVTEPACLQYYWGKYSQENIVASVIHEWQGPNGEVDDSGKFYEFKIQRPDND